MSKKCPICGHEIVPDSHNRILKTCGNPRCRGVMISRTKRGGVPKPKCIHCGKELNTGRKFCSGSCRDAYKHERWMENNRCPICGRTRKIGCKTCGNRECIKKAHLRGVHSFHCYGRDVYVKALEKARSAALRNGKNCRSNGEKEMTDFIKGIYSGQVFENYRKLFPGKDYELDAYLPELGLAFEYNGDYYHGPMFPKRVSIDFWKQEHAKDLGVRIYFIWESDWKKRRKECEDFLIQQILK